MKPHINVRLAWLDSKDIYIFIFNPFLLPPFFLFLILCLLYELNMLF